MNIIVDTDIIIDFLRLKHREETIFIQVFHNQQNIVPVVFSTTISEIWAGKSIKNPRERAFIDKLFQSLSVLYPNLEIAKLTGQIIRDKNYTIAFTDASIAACAVYYQLPFLTKNQKDFKGIDNLHFYFK